MSVKNKPLLISELPRFVFLGKNTLNLVPHIATRMNFRRNGCLVVTGPKTLKIAGKECILKLEESEFHPKNYVVTDSTLEETQKLSKLLQDYNPSFIVAVGGGKIADVAKWSVKLVEIEQKLPIEIIGVPTNAPHDGIISPYCYLKIPLEQDPEYLVESYIGKARPPVGVIADTSIIESTDFRNIIGGFAHLMSNLTSLWDWKFANRVRGTQFSDFGAALSSVGSDLLSGEEQISRPTSMDQAIRLVMKPLFVSGMGMCLSNSIRVAFGSEHLFAESLVRLKSSRETLHGERVGLGSILSAYLQGKDWTRIKGLLETVGAPVCATDLDIDPEDIIDALMNAHDVKPKIYTVLGDKGLNKEAAKNLASKTGVLN